MSLSLGMTPIKEVKADLQFVVPVPFSQPCEPRMPAEGESCCAVPGVCAWLMQLPMTVGLWGNVCLLWWQKKNCGEGVQPAVSWRNCAQPWFPGCRDPRESLPRVKLKCALRASANTGIWVQGIFWRKVVSSEQTRSYKVLWEVWMIPGIWNKAVFSHVMEGRAVIQQSYASQREAAIGWWTWLCFRPV